MHSLRTPSGSALYMAVRRRPVLFLAAACLLAGAMFSSKAPHLLTGEGLFLVGAALVLGAVAVTRRWRVLSADGRLGAVLGLALVPLFLALLAVTARPAMFLLLAATLTVLAVLAGLALRGRLEQRHMLAALLVLSFCLHLAYVLATPYESHQHDLGQAGGEHGHLPYIEYLASGGFRLPDFDPTTRVSFYNPPLHHLIAAAWLKLNTAFTADYTVALERLQLLSLFYAGWATIAGCRLLGLLGLRGRGLVVAAAIICLHPTMMILSGSINNDVLCLALMMQAAVLALRWYQRPATGTIVKLGLCIGLAMLAKSSGALVAPAVAVLFMVRLWQALHTPAALKKQLGQFAVFAAVCVPLGLCWSIYNALRFGMPFFYVPALGTDSYQYLGDIPALKRLVSLDPVQFQSVFHNWGEPYVEYNIPVALFKTSVFGEFQYADRPLLGPTAVMLFYSNLALAGLSFVGMGWTLARKAAAGRKPQQAFLGVFWLTLMVSYVQFCFAYPHACTMNYRYIVPTLFIGAAFTGLWLQDLDQSDTHAGQLAGGLIVTTATVFCCCALLFGTLFCNN